MKSGLTRRLEAVEIDYHRRFRKRAPINLSALDDAQLDRLEIFAQRRAAWMGTEQDWIRQDLTGDERLELDALLATAR